jgi:hypothetical protein
MKARYMPRTRNIPRPLPIFTDQYYISKVTINPPDEVTSEAIPEKYKKHRKVFSETSSQQLPKPTVWDHAIELLPGAPAMLPGCLLPLNQIEKEEIHKFV